MPRKCIHDKRKSQCRECGGSAFCIHDKQKSQCRECGGSSICIHDKRKSQCRECGGSALCSNQWCESIKISKKKPYCNRCWSILHPEEEKSRKYRLKEQQIVFDVLSYIEEEKIQPYEIIKNRILNACSKRRPDLFLDFLTHSIVVEIDEEQHENYSCETKRICELWEDTGHRPIVFIRFNPDKYRNENKTIPTCMSYSKARNQLILNQPYYDRLKVLTDTISNYITRIPDRSITIEQLFYNK